MHFLALLVEASAEGDGGDFDFVGDDLAGEFPLSWLIRVSFFLEKADSLVGVADCEVVPVPGHDQLLHRRSLAVRGPQSRTELLKLTCGRVHDLDFAVVLRDEDLLAVGRELDAGEDAVVGTPFITLEHGFFFFVALVVAPWITLLDIVPQQHEALCASNGKDGVLGVHRDAADSGGDAGHQGVTTLVLGLDFFEEARLEGADQGGLVGDQEVGALEDLVFFLLGVPIDADLPLGLGWSWLLFRETNTLDGGEVQLIEPSHDLELEVVELDCAASVATDQVLVVDRCQDIDLGTSSVQGYNLDQAFLILLTDTVDDQGASPDEDHADTGTSDGHFLTWDEDRLGEVSFLFLLFVEVFLLDSRGVVLELGDALLPIKEKHSLLAVGGQFMRIVWVELDPVLILELNCILVLQRYNGSILLLIGPIPKRDRLRLIVSQSCQVSVISREVQAPDTIGVRVQEGPHWCA